MRWKHEGSHGGGGDRDGEVVNWDNRLPTGVVPSSLYIYELNQPRSLRVSA